MRKKRGISTCTARRSLSITERRGGENAKGEFLLPRPRVRFAWVWAREAFEDNRESRCYRICSLA